MELPILHKVAEEGAALQQKLYAHSDYFSYIIPSTWFLTGVSALGFIFYRPEMDDLIHACKGIMRAFGEPTTALDLLAALVLLIVVFNGTFVLGHILNGFAAAILERVVARKLLLYPFQLYEKKWADTTSGRNDGERFRDAVLESSYWNHCTNLLPVLAAEIALYAFGRVNGHAGTWVDVHKAWTFVPAAFVTVLHLGFPARLKGSRYAARFPAGKRVFAHLFVGHIVLLSAVTGLVGWSIAYRGEAKVLFALALTNLLLALIDQRLRRAGKGKHKKALARYFFFYLNLTYANLAYLGAKMVGYGAGPSRELIGRAKAMVGYTSESNDFFWMAELRIQQRSAKFHDTAYHAMALQTMNRNLSNATAFVLLISVVSFLLRWPDGARHGALVWVAVLSGLSYLFFVRYLFLFAGRHSRFLIRAAALLAEDEPPRVLTPEEARVTATG